MTDLVREKKPSRDMTPTECRAALVRLLVVVGATVGVSLYTGAFPFVMVVVALVVMVMLHELGHFATAKWSGMKVTEYFLGFGPRLWSVRKGETTYGVKAIPAGGYVRIVGMSSMEELDPADEDRTFRQQSFPKRLLVLVSGSAMHFVIAFVLLFVLFSVSGVPAPTRTIGETTRIAGGPSPAQEAGLQVGDRIVSLDGHPVSRWEDLPPYIRARPGQPINLVVERGGQRQSIVVVPADVNPQGERVGFVGVGPKYGSQRVDPLTGLGRSVTGLGRGALLTGKALGSFFAPGQLKSYADQLTGSSRPSTGVAQDANRPVSVVGFTRVAGQAAQKGNFAELLVLLISINIFVGIFNMVPLLPLDGGHVAVAVYERIRSRRGRRYHADVSKLMPLTAAVVMALVVFGVAIMYLDIVRPISLQ